MADPSCVWQGGRVIHQRLVPTLSLRPELCPTRDPPVRVSGTRHWTYYVPIHTPMLHIHGPLRTSGLMEVRCFQYRDNFQNLRSLSGVGQVETLHLSRSSFIGDYYICKYVRHAIDSLWTLEISPNSFIINCYYRISFIKTIWRVTRWWWCCLMRNHTAETRRKINIPLRLTWYIERWTIQTIKIVQ